MTRFEATGSILNSKITHGRHTQEKVNETGATMNTSTKKSMIWIAKKMGTSALAT
jgi:hypothetical protein